MKSPNTLRKEPLIFLATFVLFVLTVFNAVLTSPTQLTAQTPLSRTELLLKPDDPSLSVPESLDVVLQKDRKTPFAPVTIIPPPPPKKVIVKIDAPPPPVQARPKEKALEAKDPRLSLAFMGIMHAEGGTIGLLKAIDGASVYRLRENESIEAGDARYTAVKIDTRVIELRDESGHVWPLTDGSFLPKH